MAELPMREAPAAVPAVEDGVKLPVRKKKSTRNKKNLPRSDLKAALLRVCGVDLTSIDGIDVMTAQTVVAELGIVTARGKYAGTKSNDLQLEQCE